jgi:hypothetical protein
MTIHTIGDSHSLHPWKDIKGININNIGPKLCYSIGRDGINLNQFNIEENDIVIFCFGEIDCRNHIHKHITLLLSYEEIINNIINNYFISIKNATSKFKNLHVCIYNVVPPLFTNSTGNPEYPHIGSNNERKEYTLYFNKQLKIKCEEYNYIFFDIYNKYVNNEGFIETSLSDSDVHIMNPIYISEFIKHMLPIHHSQFDHLDI